MNRRKIIPYHPKLKLLARKLRNNMTLSEVLLWNELKQKKMLGHDFNRQHPVDNYILDFVCKDLMLAIEIDGASHNGEDKFFYDTQRQKRLESLGFSFLRFDDAEVKKDIHNVLRSIQGWIENWERLNISEHAFVNRNSSNSGRRKKRIPTPTPPRRGNTTSSTSVNNKPNPISSRTEHGRNLKAVLFDMDGVLVDSEELIYLAAKQMFAEHGIEVTQEDFKPFIGAGENNYLGGVAKKYNLDIDIEHDKARTYEIYAEIAPEKLKVIPGVVQFINRCKSKNLKLAVATSADEIKMKINLKAAGLDNGIFDVTVNGLEVVNKKPHPEIYLRTAKKLQVKPFECLVVEDAVNGVESARAAGAKCLAVTTSFSESELSAADWIVKKLTEVPENVLNW